MSDPYPKSKQLARGERRYRRKIASPKQWQAIFAAKGRDCRLAGKLSAHVSNFNPVQYHHLIPRDAHGDDVADNIVPLCIHCHTEVTAREPYALAQLAASLDDAEYAYVIGKLGEGAMARLFGVGA